MIHELIYNHMTGTYTKYAIAAGAAVAITLSGAGLAFAREGADNIIKAQVSVSASASANASSSVSDDKREDKKRDDSLWGKVRMEVRANAEAKADDKSKERANKEIERRMDSLGDMVERLGDMARLSGDVKASLSAQLQAQINALVALKAKVEAATTTAVLKEEVKSITGSYRIFALVMPKAAITAHADRLTTVAAQLGTLGSKLQARIDAAKAAGTDVSAAVSAMAVFNTEVANAKAEIKAALDLVAPLSADMGNEATFKANLEVLKDAQKKLQAAQQDLKDARKEVNDIRKGLPKEAKVNATTTVGVQN